MTDGKKHICLYVTVLLLWLHVQGPIDFDRLDKHIAAQVQIHMPQLVNSPKKSPLQKKAAHSASLKSGGGGLVAKSLPNKTGDH